MQSVLYPGSFDPITTGHLDLIERAAAQFSHVVVGILHNPQKPSGAFDARTRAALIERAAGHLPGVEVRLIDRDREKCERLAKELGRTLILNGDGADEVLLTEEGIDCADGYVCATESDEVNLIYCAIAKSLGAHKCVAVVRRRSYLELPDRLPIDAVVDPNEALASVILRYIRYPGRSKALSIIEKIDAEMLEIVMQDGHSFEGIPLMELGLPKGVLVALIGRENKVFVPGGATRLRAGDHVILFASTAQMRNAARLFGEI